jgi:hypothetical protein
MKTGLTRAALRVVMAELAKLPSRAWLKASTWERMKRGGAKPGARLSGRGPGGRQTINAQIFDPQVEDFTDIAASGLTAEVAEAGLRYWVVPVQVVADFYSISRFGTLNGNVVWREAQMITRLSEVPGLVVFQDHLGRWGDGRSPEWRAVDEADPYAAFPVPEAPESTDTYEQLSLVLTVGPVTRPPPLKYARL